jgi:hypothetical protein
MCLKDFPYTRPLTPSISFTEESFVILTANFHITKKMKSRKMQIQAVKVYLYKEDLRAV